MAALLFEHTHEPIEIFGRSTIGGGRIGLRGANPVDEDVEVVQPAEQVLQVLELFHPSRRPGSPQLLVNLESVSQLLGRHADGVQAVGQVDSAGALDGLGETRGPMADAACGLGDSRLTRPAVGVLGLEMADAPSQLVELHRLQDCQHRDTPGLTLACETASEVRDGSLRYRATLGELAQVRERDVYLAYGAERPRHAPHLFLGAPERVVASAGAGDRQRLAQPTRGDARLVNRRLVAGLCGRHRIEQRREA